MLVMAAIGVVVVVYVMSCSPFAPGVVPPFVWFVLFVVGSVVAGVVDVFPIGTEKPSVVVIVLPVAIVKVVVVIASLRLRCRRIIVVTCLARILCP